MGSSSSSPTSPSSSSKYGDIREVETSGASERTARADNLSYSGVRASEAMARNDSGPMRKYRCKIYTVAGEKDIHPALIAAIISRESRAGEAIKNTGGGGDWNPRKNRWNAFGLMQIDVDEDGGNHEPEGEWDSLDHLRQATEILIYFIKRIQKKFPDWSKAEQLKGGIAAYNMGDGAVRSDDPDDVDENTTGGDYSNDVVARAHWFIENGYDD